MNFRADAPEGQARVNAFTQALQKLGWSDGGNVRVDIRYAQDLLELNPNVILASASQSVAALPPALLATADDVIE